MRDLIVLGTQVHARETIDILSRINAVRETWNLLGFIAPSAEELEQNDEMDGYPLLGTIDVVDEYPQAALVPVERFPRTPAVPEDRVVSIVDPSTFVSRAARIGRGCLIYPNCYIGHNAQIHNWVFCLSGSIINHDDVIEDGVVINSGVTLAGNLHVESKAILGQGSTIRQFTRVGRNSYVGMGAVVVKDVPPDTVVVGNPARKLRDRAEDDC